MSSWTWLCTFYAKDTVTWARSQCFMFATLAIDADGPLFGLDLQENLLHFSLQYICLMMMHWVESSRVVEWVVPVATMGKNLVAAALCAVLFNRQCRILYWCFYSCSSTRCGNIICYREFFFGESGNESGCLNQLAHLMTKTSRKTQSLIIHLK